jgi:hypothetical protein
MLNPMMYRVFLQDEKDAPDPSENPQNSFRIRQGSLLAWCYTAPGWKPTLEEQLQQMGSGYTIKPSSKQLDGHWLINYDGLPIGICHTIEEIPEKAYQLARQQARELTQQMTKHLGKHYLFVDVTSRAGKEYARMLSEMISYEEVPSPSPRAADIY